MSYNFSVSQALSTKEMDPLAYKRNADLISQGNENKSIGLDWGLVNTLDQDPTGKDYFPFPYR